MMDNAEVVQAIFRALGIAGWETVGTEPSDPHARPHDLALRESAGSLASPPRFPGIAEDAAEPRGTSRRRTQSAGRQSGARSRNSSGLIEIGSISAELLRKVRPRAETTPAARQADDPGPGADSPLLAAASDPEIAAEIEIGVDIEIDVDGEAETESGALVRDAAG